SNDNLFIFKIYKITGSPDSILHKDRTVNETVLSKDYLLIMPDTTKGEGSRKFSLLYGQRGYVYFRCNDHDTIPLKSPAEFINTQSPYLIADLMKKNFHHRIMILFHVKKNGRISPPKYITD
ncbi:MAG TPA: hypothetical protein VFJ43_18335, partial [Bacteroidia bacterium]|nr:hypothetical protein [Bacteroidia bacterium]